jgi:hypothetical protein
VSSNLEGVLFTLEGLEFKSVASAISVGFVYMQWFSSGVVHLEFFVVVLVRSSCAPPDFQRERMMESYWEDEQWGSLTGQFTCAAAFEILFWVDLHSRIPCLLYRDLFTRPSTTIGRVTVKLS